MIEMSTGEKTPASQATDKSKDISTTPASDGAAVAMSTGDQAPASQASTDKSKDISTTPASDGTAAAAAAAGREAGAASASAGGSHTFLVVGAPRMCRHDRPQGQCTECKEAARLRQCEHRKKKKRCKEYKNENQETAPVRDAGALCWWSFPPESYMSIANSNPFVGVDSETPTPNPFGISTQATPRATVRPVAVPFSAVLVVPSTGGAHK